MTDQELQQHVEKALDWDPGIEAADIGVSAEGGVVTLRGYVKTFTQKIRAERAALGVYGVKAVANDISVRLSDVQLRTDTEIAQAVVAALRWNTVVPDDKIAVTVTDGWVTLTGGVEWEYQRAAAEAVIRDLTGVRGVSNAITLEPHASAVVVKSKIESALKRSAELDARQIHVTVANNKVTLSGNVHSSFEREEARRAAWSAPGVQDVDDRIAVVPQSR